MAGGSIHLTNLLKAYGEVVAVDHIDLEIQGGEFFSLLGPSGCGKTTTLRLIAGFERPDAGAIFLDGENMADTPPHKRPVNTVFQSYALFPHLSVGENVGFGLRYLSLSKAEAAARVGEALELVRLGGLQNRKPTQLSGGQQQRVALARSLVLNPSVLLLDEPLGALDAKLRKALQIELKSLQEEVGITFIYVTHDQEEALTMSDRLAVMNHGRVEQIGTPSAVYEEPETAYIAEFLGVSNLMPATVVEKGETCTVQVGESLLRASGGNGHLSGPVSVCIRPERIELDAVAGDNVIGGVVDRVVYVGPVLQVLVDVPGAGEIQVSVPNTGTAHQYPRGAQINIRFPVDALRILEGSSTVAAEAG